MDRKFYSPYKGAILRQNVAIYLVKNLSPQVVADEKAVFTTISQKKFTPSLKRAVLKKKTRQKFKFL
ncbi:MAG: hypothetical protein IKB98_03980 [Clostridia bacterium]|nr:hypothetical protein [Clostridia bacterium]